MTEWNHQRKVRRIGLQFPASLPGIFRFFPFFLSLSVFSVAKTHAAVKNPDTYTFLSIGDPDSLDPAWSYDTSSHEIIANIYEYLVAFKGSSLTELEPRLAAKVPSRRNGLISADGRTYTFPIRNGVRFQDGSPLTAEDVRYSLLRFMLFDRDGGPSGLLLDPILGLDSTRDAKGNLRRDVFQRADKAVVVRGDDVVLHLAKPYAPFLSILTNFGAIVSKSWCARQGAWEGAGATWADFNNPKRESSPLMEKVNGTGPYALERWDKRNNEVVLVRYPGYWRKRAAAAGTAKGRTYIERAIIKVVPEFATRKLMLQAGDADEIYAPQMMFPQVSNLEGVQVIDGLKTLESPTLLLFTFKINPQGNPNIGSGKLDGAGIPPDFFSDKDVRKGFAYSVDYDAYVRDILRGKGRQARGIIPEGMLGHDPKGKMYRFDLAKAKEQFQKAWGGRAWDKGFQFTLMFNDNQPNILTLANMIKKNVESLNPKFKVDVRTVQWSTFLEQTQGMKIPIYVGAWQADYPDPHNLMYPLLDSAGYFPGKQGYKNAEADRLIEEAVTSLDPNRRAELYRRLGELEYEDLPHILVAEGLRYRTQRSWVGGWVFNPVFPDAPYGSYFYDLYKEDRPRLR